MHGVTLEKDGEMVTLTHQGTIDAYKQAGYVEVKETEKPAKKRLK